MYKNKRLSSLLTWVFFFGALLLYFVLAPHLALRYPCLLLALHCYKSPFICCWSLLALRCYWSFLTLHCCWSLLALVTTTCCSPTLMLFVVRLALLLFVMCLALLLFTTYLVMLLLVAHFALLMLTIRLGCCCSLLTLVAPIRLCYFWLLFALCWCCLFKYLTHLPLCCCCLLLALCC